MLLPGIPPPKWGTVEQVARVHEIHLLLTNFDHLLWSEHSNCQRI